VSAPSSDGLTPASQITHPDQIPPDAWGAVNLIDGELVHQVWRTAQGFLVLTNLRCVALGRRGELFPPHPWRAGSEFFFYNLRPPKVLLGRFVELSEEYNESGRTGRFAVRDPLGVADTIAAAIPPGRAAWIERRAHAEELIEARKRLRAARTSGTLPPVISVRCAFCGNLTDASGRVCSSCGAGLG
jgi:hypothetical protein